VPCRTAAEKKACFHFVSDDHDGLVASGLMALVTAVDVVTRHWLDGGVVTAQARWRVVGVLGLLFGQGLGRGVSHIRART